MYGPCFLVIERGTGRFLNSSAAANAPAARPRSSIRFCRCRGRHRSPEGGWQRCLDFEPHGPLPLTLKSRLVEKGTYSWHVPVVVKCSNPFTKMPTNDKLAKEISAFVNCKGDGVEIVKEPDGRKAHAR